MEKIFILALTVINIWVVVICVQLMKKINTMKVTFNKYFLELGKRQIDIADRIDAVSDVFNRLSDPLDRMDKNVSDMANMAEDTHLKMLYAYNEISKIKTHGKHAKRCDAPSESKAAGISVVNTDTDTSKTGIENIEVTDNGLL